jgi:magnesium transporter
MREDVEELIVLSKSSADPKIWNELRNTEIISTFKTLYYSASIPYMRLKVSDKDFKVIEVEIFSYFSRLHQKAWNFRTDRL